MYTRLCKYGHVLIMDIYNQYALLYHDGCSKYQLSTRFGKYHEISTYVLLSWINTNRRTSDTFQHFFNIPKFVIVYDKAGKRLVKYIEHYHT